MRNLAQHYREYLAKIFEISCVEIFEHFIAIQNSLLRILCWIFTCWNFWIFQLQYYREPSKLPSKYISNISNILLPSGKFRKRVIFENLLFRKLGPNFSQIYIIENLLTFFANLSFSKSWTIFRITDIFREPGQSFANLKFSKSCTKFRKLIIFEILDKLSKNFRNLGQSFAKL